MKATETTLPRVFVIEAAVFGDDRGFFMESFNAERFCELTGAKVDFVQDNHSRSGALLFASSSDIKVTAAAPSFIPEALPAVTVPSF